MSANDTQISGNHYKDKTVQPWDYIAANNLGYFEGNVVRYISRWRDKGGVDDLRKAKHYIEKLIELETQVKPQYEGERVILPKFEESKTIHGFIPWTGGDIPLVNDELVEILCRNGVKNQGPAFGFSWGHDSERQRSSDIIGYRVIK